MQESGGTLVISLDFELMWGMFDVVSKSNYEANLKGVYTVIPKILEMFSDHEVAATWATVGMLMYKDKNDLLRSMPKEDNLPSYLRSELSAYNHLKNNPTIEEKDTSYFAHTLVQKICSTKDHTYRSSQLSCPPRSGAIRMGRRPCFISAGSQRPSRQRRVRCVSFFMSRVRIEKIWIT